MLVIHHLGKSQSERIVWLCEELELPYELKRYTRNAHDLLAPPEFKALHPIGSAPVIDDGDVRLAESGAIVEYILGRYGDGRLSVAASEPNYADYLYWLHFANGTLQASIGRLFSLSRLSLPADHPVLVAARQRVERALHLVDARLQTAAWLAGPELTGADIMSVFSLTTMRTFQPIDLSPWPAIVAYLQRVGARPAYQRAMAKGDPEMPPMLT